MPERGPVVLALMSIVAVGLLDQWSIRVTQARNKRPRIRRAA